MKRQRFVFGSMEWRLVTDLGSSFKHPRGICLLLLRTTKGPSFQRRTSRMCKTKAQNHLIWLHGGFNPTGKTTTSPAALHVLTTRTISVSLLRSLTSLVSPIPPIFFSVLPFVAESIHIFRWRDDYLDHRSPYSLGFPTTCPFPSRKIRPDRSLPERNAGTWLQHHFTLGQVCPQPP